LVTASVFIVCKQELQGVRFQCNLGCVFVVWSTSLEFKIIANPLLPIKNLTFLKVLLRYVKCCTLSINDTINQKISQ